MTRISDPSIPDVSFSDVSSYGNIRIPVANIQGGVPGAKGDIGLDEIGKAAEHHIFGLSSHGLIASDEGKPLNWDGTTLSVYDDTSSTEFPLMWLQEVIDANTIRYVTNGVVQFSDTLVEAGFSLTVDGPYLFWDLSDDQYESSKPADSSYTSRALFAVLSVSGGIVTALKLPWGP
jgi:hypothetical protein